MKKTLIGLAFCLIFCWLFLKPYWLILGFLFLLFLFKKILSLIQFFEQNWITRFLFLISYFLFLLISIIILRLFIYDIFLVPSDSMKNTLRPGDFILVNKFEYGPRLPQSIYEIPWATFFCDNSLDTLKKKRWPYRRLKGLRDVSQGDIVIYELVNDYFVVKRCVAVAGQEFSIIDGEVYTDGILYNSPLSVKNKYLLKGKKVNESTIGLKSLGIINEYDFNKNDYHITGNFSKNKIKTLEKMNFPLSISIINDTLKKESLFLKNFKEYSWNLNQMGPFIIPKKGFKIKITDFTFELYKNILRNYEGVVLYKVEKEFYINGEICKDYEFKKDYFFAMGDNRNKSKDSRYFGFIPKDKIIGKVSNVLYRD